jgi:hypothetical protein
MSLLRSLSDGSRSLLRKERIEPELDEELRGFLEMAAKEKMKEGMTHKDALRAVRLERGSLEVAKEVVRSAGWESFVATLLWDTRHAPRRLRMAPAFTIATVLTLALGMGATTSIFTLVHAVLLKSLPITSPSELYRLGKESRGCYQGGYCQEKEFSLVSYDLYKYFRENVKGFAELAAFPATEPLFGVRLVLVGAIHFRIGREWRQSL